MGTKITEHYFEFSTIKYFRGKAENVEIGSFGEKKDPIGPQAYLAVEGKVKAAHLAPHVRYITTAAVTWSEATQAQVEVNGRVRYFDINASTALTAGYEQVKSANLRLAKFAIDEGPLKRLLNNDADVARNYLAREGSDGRITSEIFVALKAELAEYFAAQASHLRAVEVAGSALSLSVSGGARGTQTITLSKGTTFAYLMHKVSKWNNNKTVIEDMEDDRKGMS